MCIVVVIGTQASRSESVALPKTGSEGRFWMLYMHRGERYAIGRTKGFV